MVFAGLAAFVAVSSAVAQEPVNSDAIVVTGRQVQDMARAFADAVSAPPARENQLARFQASICPGVMGLNQRQGQFVVDRIAQRAMALGLHVEEPGCRANVLVLVTRDANALAAAIAEQERYLMANYGSQENLSTRGGDALNAFINETRPVRWWHVSQTETTRGDVLRNTDPHWGTKHGEIAIRNVEVAVVSNGEFGRLARPTLQAFRNAVLIVDAERVGNVQVSALADYLAMVSLAQLDPEADTSQQSSILNLFADAQSARMAGMTDWDLAYLHGLYAAQSNAPNERRQIEDIARRMRGDLTED
jgi:hypothetical protein